MSDWLEKGEEVLQTILQRWSDETDHSIASLAVIIKVEIAQALREVKAEGMERAAEVAWPGLELFAKELRERAQAIREGK